MNQYITSGQVNPASLLGERTDESSSPHASIKSLTQAQVPILFLMFDEIETQYESQKKIDSRFCVLKSYTVINRIAFTETLIKHSV